MRVFLGMSGGVDSSAAAVLLKNQGFDITGVTLKLFGSADKDAKRVCERLSIPYQIIDFEDYFRETVIENFISEYLRGATPNPCIICNGKIKFGAMLDFCLKNGGDFIATGHYATIKKQGDRSILCKAADVGKDQTYMLYGLTQHQLSHTVFPLGNMTKAEIRELADQNGLINAQKKDSQDICFVPDGDYAKFIEETKASLPPKGCFTDISGNVLGEHKGIVNYTVGQRKGLGIALGKPAFVIEKNAETNSIVLGDEKNLFKKSVYVKDVNYIPFDTLNGDIRVKAKLRYRQKEQSAVLHPLSEREAVIEFDQPQRAPAKGQSAVFYDEDTVIGGGIIEKGE